MKIIIRLGKLGIAVAMLPLLLAFLQETVALFLQNIDQYLKNLFFYGFIAYVVFYIVGLRKYILFFEHYCHESTHALFSYLSLRPVLKMIVAPYAKPPDNSRIERIDGSNFVIALSPYFIPLFTLPLLIVRPFLNHTIAPFVDLCIGVTFAFHCMQLLTSFHPRQTDLSKAGGLFFSFCITALFNVIIFVIVLASVSQDYMSIPTYLANSWMRTVQYYNGIVQAWNSAKESL